MKEKKRLGTNQLPLAIGHSQYQKLFLALFGCGQHKKTKIFPKQQLRMFSLKVTSCLYIYYYIQYIETVYSMDYKVKTEDNVIKKRMVFMQIYSLLDKDVSLSSLWH